MRSPRPTSPRLSGLPILSSAWALAGVLTAIVLIGASLTLLGRDVLNFSDWQSLKEGRTTALSAPAAPVAVRSPFRSDRPGARTAGGAAAAAAAGNLATAPGVASGGAGEATGTGTQLADAPTRSAPQRSGVGDDRSEGRPDGGSEGSSGSGLTPLTAQEDEGEVVATTADAGVIEEGGLAVEVQVGGRSYALPEGSKIEVRVGDAKPQTAKDAPAPTTVTGASPTSSSPRGEDGAPR